MAILGFGADAHDAAQRLRADGVRVIIGLREDDPARVDAEAEGFSVCTLGDAVDRPDVIQVW